MNIKSIVKTSAAAMILTIAAIASMTGCGSSAAVDMEDLYKANVTSSILELHDSVYEVYEYYENLDEEVTFTTSYCYSEQDDGSAIYEAKGSDAADPESADNFSYCIVGNIEYMKDSKGSMTVYPLNAQYIEDFRSKSFTFSYSDAEKLESAKYSGDSVIVTTSADAATYYGQEALSSINALCPETVKEIKIIYTAEKDSLLLTNQKTYYVGESGTEYLFCEESLIYDQASLDLSYASEYINPSSTRTITVIEKPEGQSDISNTFTIGSGIIPNFECFRTYSGYTIYNDPDGLDPYDTETADEGGNYPSITLYALPTSALQTAASENTGAEAAGQAATGDTESAADQSEGTGSGDDKAGADSSNSTENQ